LAKTIARWWAILDLSKSVLGPFLTLFGAPPPPKGEMLETLGRTLKNGVFGVFFGHFSTSSTPGATLLRFEQPTPKNLIFLPFFLIFFKTINGAVGKFGHPETRFLRCFSDPWEAAAANKANSGFSRNLRNFFEEIYFLDRKKLEIFP
jgi:hypothetical protein